jgi:hypothetical protein
MGYSKAASRLALSACLVALAACSGGGGGGSVNTGTTGGNGTGNTTGNTSGNTTGNTSGNTSGSVAVTQPDPATVTPAASGFNFTTNLPPVGTVFSIVGPAAKVTQTSASAAGIGTNATATYRGTVVSNGLNVPVFDLSIPAINFAATNVRGDGTVSTGTDGSKSALNLTALTYTVAGAWGYTPASGTVSYIGSAATGSATPVGNLPTTGSATYVASGTKGGVGGAFFVPSGSGTIAAGTLAGEASVTTNFASGAVSGSLTNMMATATTGGAATPWNSVSITGNIARSSSSVGFNGTTSTTSAPTGAGVAGFSNSATGTISGAFFGPNAEEIGATWTLTEPNAAGGGKTAFGVLAGTK